MTKLAIFCGSSLGVDTVYAEAARQLAAVFCAQNISLVYGGATVGLMGIVADAMLKQGGEVIGVIPQFLMEKEIAHTGISKLHVVNSMHERKALMAELADGFILLPGGTGSLEEFFEIITWTQLGLQQKPCGILNVADYYNHLFKFLDHAVTAQFLKPQLRQTIMAAERPQELLAMFANYQPSAEPKWIKSTTQT